MKTECIHATEHMPEVYRKHFDGYRAVRLFGDDGRMTAELVWRLASGDTVEILDFGVFDDDDRRRGLGTKLFKEALTDIRDFFEQYNLKPWRIYVFCEQGNTASRAFYEFRGFKLIATLKDFYRDGSAVMYSLDISG